MVIATLKKAHIPSDDLVVIPRREYEDLKEKATSVVGFPVVRLRGKAASVLDRRVTAALREYRAGKLRPIASLRQLM